MSSFTLLAAEMSLPFAHHAAPASRYFDLLFPRADAVLPPQISPPPSQDLCRRCRISAAAAALINLPHLFRPPQLYPDPHPCPHLPSTLDGAHLASHLSRRTALSSAERRADRSRTSLSRLPQHRDERDGAQPPDRHAGAARAGEGVLEPRCDGGVDGRG